MLKENRKYICLFLYLFCILMMFLHSTKKCISVYPKENLFVYIIAILCMIYFLKEQSIKKNIIIIYINVTLFSIVFIYNCLRNTTLNMLGMSEESVKLLYDLAGEIFQDITKFFIIYFVIATVLISLILIKKHTKRRDDNFEKI